MLEGKRGRMGEGGGRRGKGRGAVAKTLARRGDLREAQRKTKAKEGTLARQGATRGTEEDERATRGAEGRGKAKGMQLRGRGRYASILHRRVHYVHEHKRGTWASRGL